MNFVDPKEYDIPGLVRKNRYKTILPSKYSLPRGGVAGVGTGSLPCGRSRPEGDVNPTARPPRS